MQVHGDERDRKRRSKYKVKYSMQITVTVVEGTSLCRKSMGGPRHLTFLPPPLKPFILREWSWLLSTHSSEFDMKEFVYTCIYTYCNTLSYIYFHRYNGSRVHLSFRTITLIYFPIRRNDRVRALRLLWFRNGGIIEHWLRAFYSPSTMIGLYESGLLLLRSSPFSLPFFFLLRERIAGWLVERDKSESRVFGDNERTIVTRNWNVSCLFTFHSLF